MAGSSLAPVASGLLLTCKTGCRLSHWHLLSSSPVLTLSSATLLIVSGQDLLFVAEHTSRDTSHFSMCSVPRTFFHAKSVVLVYFLFISLMLWKLCVSKGRMLSSDIVPCAARPPRTPVHGREMGAEVELP